MSKKDVPERNSFHKSILKNKYALTILTIFLLLGLCGCLMYNTTSNKRTVVDNTNIIKQSEPKSDDNVKKDSYDISDNSKTENLKSFNGATLINDNRGVPVLYYHSVRESADNEVTITPEKLRTQLEYIKNQGYITLTINQLTNYLLNNSPIPEKSIVITFDDGYMDNYYNAFPILKDLNMVATIFCITSNLDGSYYLSKEALTEMSNYGIDIESHTVNHPKLDQMTYDEQLIELKDSKKTLESITGKEVNSIAYPFGNFNDDSIKAAKNAGYTLAFTTNRGLADRNDNLFRLDRIYINSEYDMNTFKEVLTKTEK